MALAQVEAVVVVVAWVGGWVWRAAAEDSDVVAAAKLEPEQTPVPPAVPDEALEVEQTIVPIEPDWAPSVDEWVWW